MTDDESPVPADDEGSLDDGTSDDGLGTGDDQELGSDDSSPAEDETGEEDETGDTMEPEPPPSGQPAVHWVGRFDDTDPSAVRMGWSGSGFVVRFDGTGASVRMSDEGEFFTVIVDGVVQPRLQTSAGEQTYGLASALPPGEHQVEVYRRTEGQWGTTVVHEVVVEGELLPPPVFDRRIELIGDSMSNGYGNEGTEPCAFTTDTQNHYETYGAMVAREVEAELHVVSWSGKGVLFNYGDDTFEPIPELYPRAVPLDPSSEWGSSWQPNLVVFNLGTNDFSTDGDPSAEQFIGAYEQFIGSVRGRYPEAFFLVLAPILAEPEQGMVEGYIDEVLTRRADVGDTDIAFADINVPWIGMGCHGHPTVATHDAMATVLREQVAAHMGW